MTRLFRTAGIAALLLGIAQAGSAQSNKPIGYGLSAGVSMPSGDFGKFFDTGYNAALHLYFRRANRDSRLQFRGNVTYDHWKVKTVGIDGTGRAIGGTVDAMIYLTARGATLRPYLVGGGGFYNYQTSLSAGNQGEASATKPAVQGGGGLEFNLSGFSTLIEVKFVNVFPQAGNARWMPISFGIHL